MRQGIHSLADWRANEKTRGFKEIRTRQCRVPTINHGRETALPCPLYHSGAAGIDMSRSALDTSPCPDRFDFSFAQGSASHLNIQTLNP